MAKRNLLVSRSELKGYPTPSTTSSYTTIQHGSIIDEVEKKLSEKGIIIFKEVFKASQDGGVATGVHYLTPTTPTTSDPDLQMAFVWANSYDKSTRFKCGMGGYILANGGLIVPDTIKSFARKHTGNADIEAKNMISAQLDQATMHFKQILIDKNLMSKTALKRSDYAKLIGTLYFEKSIFTPEQISELKELFDKPSYVSTTSPETLWEAYANIIVALQRCHPRFWIETQQQVHFTLCEMFGINLIKAPLPSALVESESVPF